MSRGRWIELERQWQDTNVDQCAVCGRLVTRRAWTFPSDAGERLACSPACEELYETYWWPTHGKVRRE